MDRAFDFIIFGATGFTGKYCVTYAPRIFSGYKWAVAGRNVLKLQDMLREMGQECGGMDLSGVPVLIADVDDRNSVRNLTQQCRVLINCCGPFIDYGEPVVSACVETGTDYVDITAEPDFMELMVHKYGVQAQNQGIYSISACGFDSILCEMGMIFAEDNFHGTIHSMDVLIRIRDKGPLLGAAVNYGTWSSMVMLFGKNSKVQEIRALLQSQPKVQFPPPQMKTKVIHKSKVTKNWYVPFPNVDRRVAKRTQKHFQDKTGKRPVQIREYYDLGSTFILCIGAVIAAWFLFLLTRFEFGVNLLLRYPRFFSLGQVSKVPNKEKYTTATFEHTFHSKGWSVGEELETEPTHELVTVVSGTNPAYGATCVCLLLSALTLVTERESLPGRGGVLTPGVAFRDTKLISNLISHGVDFKVAELMRKCES